MLAIVIMVAAVVLMGFSVFVEMINLRVRGVATAPVRLHQPYVDEAKKQETRSALRYRGLAS